jgi:hypothetical protein
MKIQFKKISDKAHSVNLTQIGFTLTATDVKVHKNEDNTPLVAYETDIIIDVPAGHFAKVTAPTTVAGTSLALATEIIVLPEDNTAVTIPYRIASGNVLAKVFQPGDVVGIVTIHPVVTAEYENLEFTPVLEADSPHQANIEADDSRIPTPITE